MSIFFCASFWKMYPCLILFPVSNYALPLPYCCFGFIKKELKSFPGTFFLKVWVIHTGRYDENEVIVFKCYAANLKLYHEQFVEMTRGLLSAGLIKENKSK